MSRDWRERDRKRAEAGARDQERQRKYYEALEAHAATDLIKGLDFAPGTQITESFMMPLREAVIWLLERARDNDVGSP